MEPSLEIVIILLNNIAQCIQRVQRFHLFGSFFGNFNTVDFQGQRKAIYIGEEEQRKTTVTVASN
jgi:hypothetical protein